jgi:peroxiredoxin
MTLSVGDRLPDATLVRMGDEGPEQVQLSEVLKGRKVVLFALPGAFTGPCTTAHLPSFIRTADDFRAKGVDEIVCLSVNDPFVLKAWAEDDRRRQGGDQLSGRCRRVVHQAGWGWISPRRIWAGRPVEPLRAAAGGRRDRDLKCCMKA